MRMYARNDVNHECVRSRRVASVSWSPPCFGKVLGGLESVTAWIWQLTPPIWALRVSYFLPQPESPWIRKSEWHAARYEKHLKFAVHLQSQSKKTQPDPNAKLMHELTLPCEESGSTGHRRICFEPAKMGFKYMIILSWHELLKCENGCYASRFCECNFSRFVRVIHGMSVSPNFSRMDTQTYKHKDIQTYRQTYTRTHTYTHYNAYQCIS